MSALAAYYRRELSASLGVYLAYRGAVTIWLCTGIVPPLVFVVVWRTVAGDGAIGGYSADEFVTYYLTAMVVDHLTFIWMMWEFEWRIRTGAFSALLLRPIHPLHHDVCQLTAYKLLGLVAVLPAAVVLGAAFDADVSGMSPATWAAFVPALFLAAALRFLVEWSLALSAFWLTKVSAINSVYFALFTFLGGQFAPLSVLPETLQRIAAFTPFPWMLAFPVEVLLGRRTGEDLVVGYAAQLAWLLTAVGVLALVWRRAIRRYSAVGA